MNWVPVLIALIWVSAALHSLRQDAHLSLMAGLLCLLIALYSLVSRKGSILILIIGSAGIVLTWLQHDINLALDGLRNASSLVAFLASLYMLRGVIQTSPAIHTVQSGLDGLSQKSQFGAIQLLGFTFSVPLAVGAVGVIGPLVNRIKDGDLRNDTATWAIRGIGLAVFVSPFTVAMGTVTNTLEPNLSVSMLLFTGFSIAFACVGVSFLLRHCEIPFGLSRIFWAQTLRVFLPIFFLVAAVITLVSSGHLTAVSSITILAPCLATIMSVIRGPAARKQMTRIVIMGWRNMDGEVAAFVTAMVFATSLAAHPTTTILFNGIAEVFGPGFLIALTVVGVSGLAMLGIHMLITTTIFLTAFGPHMQDALQMTLLGMAGLIGWGVGSMVALGSPAFILATRIFMVDRRTMAFGTNMPFLLVVIFLFCLFAYFS